MAKTNLRLYVTGKNTASEHAIANLRHMCANELKGEFELIIVDVLEQPQLAEDEGILATPTLVKKFPLPHRRIIGDLSDRGMVLLGLGLEREEE